MATKVHVNLTGLAKLARKNERLVLKGAKEAMKMAINQFILKGISPVKGEKRFIRYKDPDSYPGDAKPKRPVNLRLTGKLIKALSAKLRGKSIFMGVIDPTQEDKARGLIEGARGMNGPRVFIPQDGQTWKPKIIRKIRDEIVAGLAVKIRKNNRAR